MVNHGPQAGVTLKKMVSATLSATMRARSLSLPTLSATESMDAEIFKVNLKSLLDARGMSLRELAEHCGLGYQWVRRVCSRGLTRVEDRNRDQLQAICKLFGVSPVERLWNADLQAGKDEAAWYASKLEEILNATRSLSDFSRFEPIDKSLIADLKRLIDLKHLALKEVQDGLAKRHEESLYQQRRWGDSFTSRAYNDVEQLRKAAEYSAKLRQVFRTNSIENSKSLSIAANVIDALFFEKQASRIVTIFRDREQKRYEDWLVFSGSRETFENSVAVALATFLEDQVLTWLTSHSPPDDPCDGSIADWTLIREWMIATNREAMKGMSTHGGDVASSE